MGTPFGVIRWAELDIYSPDSRGEHNPVEISFDYADVDAAVENGAIEIIMQYVRRRCFDRLVQLSFVVYIKALICNPNKRKEQSQNRASNPSSSTHNNMTPNLNSAFVGINYY
jgi:hypothetical protein